MILLLLNFYSKVERICLKKSAEDGHLLTTQPITIDFGQLDYCCQGIAQSFNLQLMSPTKLIRYQQ